jgi:hypothetical protein
LLESVLPTDEASTDLYRVHAAYAALAFTDPALAAVGGPDELLPVLSDLLAGLGVSDAALAATALLALCTGLSAYLTSGFLTSDDALRALHAELDRVI